MMSELTLDYESASFAYAAGLGLIPDTPHQVLCDLLYHICFGDVEKAKDLADQLAHLSLTDRTEHLSFLLNAGYAQYRLGLQAAEDTLSRGLSLARRVHGPTGELHAIMCLAYLCWSHRRKEDCKSWLRCFAELMSHDISFDAMWEYHLLSARVAVDECRFDDAELSLRSARASGQSALELPRLIIDACEVEIRLARGLEPCTEPELSTLLNLYLRSRGIGRQDEPTFAVVSSLRHHKRFLEAGTLLRDYLEAYRRDGFPPSQQLVGLL
jgi:hypothetical protein